MPHEGRGAYSRFLATPYPLFTIPSRHALMKIKRYLARDMRQALRQVREEQGPDAVILSTRRVNGGVEVEAAVDYEQPTHARAKQAPAQTRGYTNPQVDAVAEVAQGEDFAAEFAALSRPAEAEPAGSVGDELKTLRRMLETQLATLAWNDLTRRAPLQTELLRQLSTYGLSGNLAAELVAKIPSNLELSEAQRLMLALLARSIKTVEDTWLTQGGMVTLVGPTGVGKTTLLAKLAARWVMQHGSRDIALVSTDAVRIGAPEQIHTLGRLLGVPAYAVESARELVPLLAGLADRRLVLVDSAGLSQRDPKLEDQLQQLADAHPRMSTALVISASAQAGALDETVERFRAARPASCVLTKLDEAATLGGVLSVLIRSQLAVAYVSEGQQIPEDLSPARAHRLIARAVELARKAGAYVDEDLLQRRFGGVAHALA